MGDGRQELRLTSGIEAVTRGNIQNTEIEQGETVCAWVSDAVTLAACYDAVELTVGSRGALNGESMYFPQTGNAVDIRALHGRFDPAGGSGEPGFPAEIGFTVAPDQRAADGKDYIESDFLYAAANGVPYTPYPVKLKFYHMLSKLELKIVKSAEVTDAISSVKIDGVALGGTFTPKADADLAQQGERAAMIVPGEQTGQMILSAKPIDAEAGGDCSNDAIVVPQSVGGKTMTFTLASGGVLVYTFPADKAFESGKRHVYTVTLRLTGVEVESTIEPWDDSEEPIDGDATLPRPLFAQIGDYYYSDGTFSTDLDPDKTVIGIVFQTDPARIGQAEKDALKEKGVTSPHGLVMAVKGLDKLYWYKDLAGNYDRDETEIGLPEIMAGDLAGLYAAVDADIEGYRNNLLIRTKRTEDYNAGRYPAFKAIETFNESVPAPEQTTGWYLPASGQWLDIVRGLCGLTLSGNEAAGSFNKGSFSWSGVGSIADQLNVAMQDIPDKTEFTAYGFYWASSVIDSKLARSYIFNNAQSGGTIYCQGSYKNKGDDGNVRAVLAF